MLITIEQLSNKLLKDTDPIEMIEFFQAYLKELEESCDEELDPELDEDRQEQIAFFENAEQSIYNKAKIFFDSYYQLIQEVGTILEPDSIIEKFELALNRLNNLKLEIAHSSMDKKDQILEYLEEVQLKLDNRSFAIKTEQKYLKQMPETQAEDMVSIEDEDGFKYLVLELQEIPSPLIGMSNLLNYQLLSVMQTNNRVIEKLYTLSAEHGIKNVHIRSRDEITEEEYMSFISQIEEDKDYIKSILESGQIEESDEEELLDIAQEVSLNLLFRLAWNGDLKLIPNF